MTKRAYSWTEKVDAVALAATVGPLRAAEQLGYPVSTVVYWTRQPAFSSALAEAEQTLAERLKLAHAKALNAVIAGLDNPKTRLSDRAAALRVLGDQLNLAEGRSNWNSTNLNVAASPMDALTWDQRNWLSDVLDRYEAKQEDKRRLQAMDPEARAALEQTAEAIERMSEAELEAAGPGLLRTVVGWLERSGPVR